MNPRLRRIFASVLAGAGGGEPTYAEILRDTYGANEIYVLSDIASGTTISAFVNAAYNGAIGGAWDLQNASGPVAGTLAPYLDGTADYGNLINLAPAFNGAIGGAIIFGRVSAAGDWSDGVDRYLFRYQVDANSRIYAYKHGTLGLYVFATIGGVSKLVNLGIPAAATDWFMVSLSWQDSANGNAMKAYLNGTQVGATQTGFGAWAGTTALNALGASTLVPAGGWKGWLDYHALKFGSIWTPTDMGNIYANP